MSIKVWLGLAAVVVVAVGVALVVLPTGAEWTTNSPEALAEFNAAIDAMMKVYRDDVPVHLEKAVALDPDFVIAKLYLLNVVKGQDEERAARLWNDVMSADLSKLTPRERVIIQQTRALRENRRDDAERMLDDYIKDHPNDPFMLHRKALESWTTGDFDEAERLNQRIIEIAPNWVVAYNQLGYIAMSRGRFVEAEEYFTSYRFVAPDQANPHDSLGELYLLLGRYDEAETSLLRSIEIKPDFWAAYEHLAMVRVMQSDFAGASEALASAGAQGDMPEYWSSGISCYVRFAELAATRRYREIVDRFQVEGEPNPCLSGHNAGFVATTIHRAACIVDDRDIALELEDQMAKLIESVKRGDVKMELPDVEGLYAHMQGVRLAVNGDYDGALEQFRVADDRMSYMQAGIGLLKLYNRLFMVETLFAAGDDGKAHQLLSKVRSVNPSLVDEFEQQGLKYLGLERRRAS